MKFSKMRIFRQMIISILAVVLAFYAMGLFNNYYNRRTLSQEITRSLSARNHFFATQLENDVNSLLLAQIELGNDNNLLNIHVLGDRMTPYQQTVAIRDVSAKLASIKRLHGFVKRIEVYLPQKGKIISSETPIYESYSPGENDDRMEILLDDGAGAIYLTVQHPFSIRYSNYSPSFFIRSEITSAQLSELLGEMLGENEGQLYLIHHSGQVAATTTGEALPPPVLERLSGGIEEPAVFMDEFLTACTPVSPLRLTLVYSLPRSAAEAPAKQFLALNAGLTVLMVALLVAYASYMRMAFMRPLEKIMDTMNRIPYEEDLLEEASGDEFSVIYRRYNEMVTRLDRLISENYEVKYRAHMSELRQLQYQIRPHFLYNSIFLIYRMAKSGGNEDIAEYAGHLGRYYQYITRFSDKPVPIGQEIDHVMHYLDIQRMRYGGRIRVEVGPLPEEARDMTIAPLLLQPLVENAYEHGLKDMVEKGRLTLDMYCSEGYLNFSAEDNGAGMPQSELEALLASLEKKEMPENAGGLVNTNLRLTLLYGEESRLRLMNLPEGGFRVSVKIPLDGEGHV